MPIISDHLPIHAIIPGKEPLAVISWNIMGLTAGKYLGLQDLNNERYDQVADFLAEQAEGVDVIALQEVSEPDQILIPRLRDKLGEDWEFVSSLQQVTAYRKNKFTQVGESTFSSEDRVLSVELVSRDKNQFTIHNVWSDYSFTPDYHEQSYKKLLQEQQGKGPGTRIVIGDTNSRVASVNPKIQDIVTAIIPSDYNTDYRIDKKLIILDHPDGVFYVDDLGDKNIHQANTKNLLNFAEIDASRLADNQRLFRPIITLDSYFDNYKNNDEFKPFLSTYNDDFTGYLSANYNNETGVTLQFPVDSVLYDYVKAKLNNKDPNVHFYPAQNVLSLSKKSIQQQSKESIQQQFCSANQQGMRGLHQALHEYQEFAKIKSNFINTIDDQIIKLKSFRLFLRNPDLKIAALTSLKNSIEGHKITPTSSKKDFEDIIDKWHKEKTQDRLNEDIVAEHRNIFKSKKRPGTDTSTQTTIKAMKDKLNAIRSEKNNADAENCEETKSKFENH